MRGGNIFFEIKVVEGTFVCKVEHGNPPGMIQTLAGLGMMNHCNSLFFEVCNALVVTLYFAAWSGLVWSCLVWSNLV